VVRWSHALVGGALAALIFELMKTSFAWYITRFPTYTAVYGAFAALPIFFLWMYLSWLVTLFGAALTAALPSLRYEKVRKVRHPGERFVNALLILRELNLARAALPQPGLRREQLMARLRMSTDTFDQLLDQLDQLGLVGRLETEGRTERWAMICDPAQTTVGYLHEQMAFDRHYFDEHLLQHFPALGGWLKDLVAAPALTVSLASLFALDAQSTEQAAEIEA
jgi:membrane protein